MIIEIYHKHKTEQEKWDYIVKSGYDNCLEISALDVYNEKYELNSSINNKCYNCTYEKCDGCRIDNIRPTNYKQLPFNNKKYCSKCLNICKECNNLSLLYNGEICNLCNSWNNNLHLFEFVNICKNCKKEFPQSENINLSDIKKNYKIGDIKFILNNILCGQCEIDMPKIIKVNSLLKSSLEKEKKNVHIVELL